MPLKCLSNCYRLLNISITFAFKFTWNVTTCLVNASLTSRHIYCIIYFSLIVFRSMACIRIHIHLHALELFYIRHFSHLRQIDKWFVSMIYWFGLGMCLWYLLPMMSLEGRLCLIFESYLVITRRRFPIHIMISPRTDVKSFNNRNLIYIGFIFIITSRTTSR